MASAEDKHLYLWALHENLGFAILDGSRKAGFGAGQEAPTAWMPRKDRVHLGTFWKLNQAHSQLWMGGQDQRNSAHWAREKHQHT
ncbi:MAG: hypothetical protein C5B49_03535 [Bdellovibrio sp.]|nr:MAG: hypothetical protein C5B49_03535 [Bdellovibrio sp.]